jgi:exonuclease VII small subunit
MVYFNFNNVQLSAGSRYVIWVKANYDLSDIPLGSSTKYLWGSIKYGTGYGSYQSHLKSVIGNYVTGSTETSAVYEIYAMVTGSSTSAVTGLIKTNSSGLLDKSFLAYDIDFGSHKLMGVSTPSLSTDAANKSYVDSQIALEASTRAAADTAEASARAAADNALQLQINNILNNTDATALNSLAEIVTAFQQADSNLNQAITNISNGSTLALNQEASLRAAADTAEASARQAATAIFARFSQELTSIDIENGYIELANVVKHESVNAFIDRLVLRHSLDYTLSNVNGKTRLVFTSTFLSSAEAPAAGDSVHGNFAYTQGDQGS